VGAKLVLVISGKAMTAVFLLVLPLAVFFAAALLAISLYARNYKEAQSYIGPMMFLVIFPAMGSFIPGVELNAGMALIPVLNISLLARELFAGQYPWNLIAVIFFSTSLYAAAAIYFAVRQFQREEVIFRA
jgi:sodium transport system permease protein